MKASDLLWTVTTAVPFDWQWSKNRIWLVRAGTHAKRLAPHARSRRANLESAVRDALRYAQRVPVDGPLFVAGHCEIPDMHGDACNAMDLALDAVKHAAGVDDRWFQLGGWTWSMRKDGRGRLEITLGQWHDRPHAICSICAELLELSKFTRQKTSRNGRSSACASCQAAVRRERKKPRASSPPPVPFDTSSARPPW